jgi:hypothetical protein
MGGHAHACQGFLFQEVDLVDQSSHLRDFEWSRLFTLGSLELEELAYEGGEAGFVILAVELCSMPSSERIFHGKIKETNMRAGLEAYAPYNFSVGGARLVLQEVVFEEWEAWRNPMVSFIEMDKDSDLENGVRVQMDKLYLVVVKKSAEEIASRESKPALEERGEHHNFIRIGCGNVFSSGGLPLQHGTVGEKIVRNKFVNLFFVCDGWLEDLGMRGDHC